MRTVLSALCLSSVLLPALSVADNAANGDFHPALTDKFLFNVGAYLQHRRIQVSAKGGVELDDELIDFDETFKGGENENLAAANLHWRFGEKWWLEGEIYSTRFREGVELEEDKTWNGLLFPAGSYAKGGFDTDLYRVLLGRKVFENAQSEFSLGLGLHWLKLSAFIEGEALVDDETTGLRNEGVSGSAPLPNISAWYLYSWSPNWALQARFDWFKASIGDYSGGLTNTAVGVNWAFSRHFGANLSWKRFSVNVDVEKNNWYGELKHTQNGPFISLYSSW